MKVNNSLLHHRIIKFIIDEGYAPDVGQLAWLLGHSDKEIEAGLQRLQDNHGVVLHPNSSKIWVIHPFSLAPTNFMVRQGNLEWWGNCAWCSLGIAALVKGDVTITTTLGADGERVGIHIKDGKLQETDYWIHFPVPMKNAWDNVIYTCSTMLFFEDKNRIEEWCKKHNINKGDVQPIAKVWEFSKAWYGGHLDPNWKKWTAAEAKQIFKEHGLRHVVWQLPESEERF